MRARVLTAAAAIPVVLGAVFWSHPFLFLALATFIFAVAEWEFLGLVGVRSIPLVMASTFLFALLGGVWFTYEKGVPDIVVLLLAEAMALASIASGFKKDAPNPGRLFLIAEAFGWIGAPLISLVIVHQGAWNSTAWHWKAPLLLILLPLWAGDIAGIFTGMALGRHKLAPSISPKKTVEGAFGNVLASVLVAWVVGYWLRFPTAISLGCGVAISVFGQAGDLFESALKRKAGVKDSGRLLPGHGGVLDRVDSLLFAAIPAVLIMSIR